MRSEIPRWVISALSLWGRQKRRVWVGKDFHGNVDGYTQSLLGRIRDEQIMAKGDTKLVHGEDCGRPPTQHWPEVFWGVGLEVQRAAVGMREIPYCVLHLHYVWLPEWELSPWQKSDALGIKKSTYFQELEVAETWVNARLDPAPEIHPAPVARVKVIPQPSKPVTDLNFGALRRERLCRVS